MPPAVLSGTVVCAIRIAKRGESAVLVACSGLLSKTHVPAALGIDRGFVHRHCLGPLGSDCLSCKGGKTLLKADDARAHGSCISCSNTCKPGECSGDGANECTACFLGKTLVPLPGLSSVDTLASTEPAN